MGPLMVDGVGAADKALPTVRALAGLPLPGDLLVFGQGPALLEALPTLKTLVGPLPAVDVPVGDEVGVVLEALPAVGAVKGPLPRVRPLVHKEIGAGLKPLLNPKNPVQRTAQRLWVF